MRNVVLSTVNIWVQMFRSPEAEAGKVRVEMSTRELVPRDDGWIRKQELQREE